MPHEEERRTATPPETAAWLEQLPTYLVENPPDLGTRAATGSPGHAASPSETPSMLPAAPVMIETLPTQPLPPAATSEEGPYEGMVWVRPPQRHRRASAPLSPPHQSAPHQSTRYERSETRPPRAARPPARPQPQPQPPAGPMETPRPWAVTRAPSPIAAPGPAPYAPTAQAPARAPSRPMAHSQPATRPTPIAPAPEAPAAWQRAPVSRAPGRMRLDVPEGKPAMGAARPLVAARSATVPLGPSRVTTPIAVPARPAKEARREAKHEVDARAKAGRRPGRVRALLVTLVIVLLVNVALQFNRRALDVASDQYAALSRVERCESLGTVPDVLFLGSSRVVHGADAQLVDQVVRQQDGLHITSCNVGDFGSTFELDYYILKRFIEDGYTPKLVVENVWEMNLNANAQGGVTLPADADAEHFAEAESVADLGDLPSLAPRFGQFGGWGDAAQYVATKAIPLYGDRIALYNGACGALQSLARSQQPVGPCGENTSQLGSVLTDWYAKADRNGWVAQTDPPLGTMTPAQVAARSGAEAGYIRQYLHDFKIGGLQPEYLRKLIALAQAHGVKVALVTSPLDAMYFTYLSPASWNEIVAYWQSVARATGVPYYDESHAAGYTNMDFVDPQHPSIEGAHQFSTWMAETIVGPALRCQAPHCVWR